MYNNGLEDEAFEAWAKSNYDFRKGHRPDQMLLTGMIFGVTNAAMVRDPRFLDLCDSLGLCDYWANTGRWPDCAAQVADAYDFKGEVLARVNAR